MLYGLMTEEITFSYDGGLYAELVSNRAFKEDAANPVHWAGVEKRAALRLPAGLCPLTEWALR
jgi:alpha-N-arabinofuranosidase